MNKVLYMSKLISYLHNARKECYQKSLIRRKEWKHLTQFPREKKPRKAQIVPFTHKLFGYGRKENLKILRIKLKKRMKSIRKQ